MEFEIISILDTNNIDLNNDLNTFDKVMTESLQNIEIQQSNNLLNNNVVKGTYIKFCFTQFRK